MTGQQRLRNEKPLREARGDVIQMGLKSGDAFDLRVERLADFPDGVFERG